MPTETPDPPTDGPSNGRPHEATGTPTDPAVAAGRSRPARYPARTRLAIAAVLLVAGGAFAVAGLSAVTADDTGLTVTGTDGGERGDRTRTPGIESRQPGQGAEIPGQQTIGIDLAPGWTGEIELRRSDGTVVLSGDDFEEVEELDLFRYQPLPGRAIERLSGDYCLVATIWERSAGRPATEVVDRFCFTAF